MPRPLATIKPLQNRSALIRRNTRPVIDAIHLRPGSRLPQLHTHHA